jgi:serine protease inhibitor
MRRISVMAWLLIAALAITSCTVPVHAGDDLMKDIQAAKWPEEVAEIAPAFREAVIRFSWNMMAELPLTDENRMISPLSAYLALAMTVNGANGKTRIDMLKTLASEGLEIEDINAASRDLMVYLSKTDPNNKLSIANSIWYRESFSPDPAFLQSNADYFAAGARKLDFSDPKTVDVINRWVKDATEGTIEEIIDSIESDTVMFLINAIYFNAQWETKFEKKNTYDGTFAAPDGSVNAQFMKRSGMIQVIREDIASGVILPYENRKFAFLALLPKEGMTPEEMLSNLDSTELDEMIGRSMEQDASLILPKFESEYELGMKDILTNLGMGIAFDTENADFSLMQTNRATDLFIKDVTQKTFVRVDELGTEAAAVTKVEVGLTSMPMPEFEIRFDRPFFYCIVDMETGIPLFIGILTDPSE